MTNYWYLRDEDHYPPPSTLFLFRGSSVRLTHYQKGEKFSSVGESIPQICKFAMIPSSNSFRKQLNEVPKIHDIFPFSRNN